MIAAAFECVTGKLQGERGAGDGAENLCKRNVEIAQTCVGRFLLRILLLGMGRQTIVQVTRLVRERGMLRHQQQSRQQYLQ